MRLEQEADIFCHSFFDYFSSAAVVNDFLRCQLWWYWFVSLATTIWDPNFAEGLGKNKLAMNNPVCRTVVLDIDQ